MFLIKATLPAYLCLPVCLCVCLFLFLIFFLSQVHGLSQESWEEVEVIPIDIADRTQVNEYDYKADEDPAIFRSEKTGRGPLGPDWKQEKRLFTNFHRQLFCWLDRWVDFSMEDIRRMEEETQKELDKVEGERDALWSWNNRSHV
ncbi:UNVERIFIED_CONTAM: hypothetical protein FKN15_014855 [Acipenser sinensis]